MWYWSTKLHLDHGKSTYQVPKKLGKEDGEECFIHDIHMNT